MDDRQNGSNRQKQSGKKGYAVIILEAVSAVVVIAVLLIIKYFGGDIYTAVKEAYIKYFEPDTVAEDITEPEINEETEILPTEANNVPEVSKTVLVKTEKIVNNSFLIPVQGVISSGFGYRNDPFTSLKKMHKGTDIAASEGTDIIAAASGVISRVAFDKNGYGNYCVIKHGNNLKTLYAHCSQILVKEGEEVTAGDVIAKVGSTGQSTGNHLHFEIRLNEIPVNAEFFVDL